MSAYQNDIKAVAALKAAAGSSWSAIDPESVARMRAQNRFKTGLEIAQYTADIMRKDMAEYDADSSVYTQSLGCWHGFIGQQKLISIKKHLKTTNKRYLYLSGWMVAALRSDFGPLPDQSMHEKTSVSGLIEELYTFLRQADARELDLLFTALDAARAAGDKVKADEIQAQIDGYETHVVPIIADIDAGFGNPEATYLLAKKNGVEEHVTFEMLEGMANHLPRVMRSLEKQIILYTPVVKDEHFLNAVSYLVRRMDENTGKDNFLTYSFNLKFGSKHWNFLQDQFLEAFAMKDTIDTTPKRKQNRNLPVKPTTNINE